jgi:hypothetical protein
VLTIKRLLCGLPALLLPLFALAHLSRDVPVRVPPPAGQSRIFSARSSVPAAVFARRHLTNNDVVARVMSFDHNHDGKVGRDELLERMHGLMDRDADGDGALTRGEIMSGGQPPRPSAPVRGFGAAQYGFDEESEDASRAHINGALADLKLPKRRYQGASAVVNRFLDERVRQASLRPQDQPTATEPRVVVRSKNGRPTRVLTAFRSAPRMPRLQEAERSRLAAELATLLTDEERNDFVAAISRQPIKKVSFQPGRNVVSGAELRRPNATVVVRPAFVGAN